MMAAWQVRPPRSVTMADARFITGSQLGSVMSVTSTSPFSTRSISSADAITRTVPAAMREPTARPVTSTSPCSSRRKRSSTRPLRLRTVSGRACST